MSGHDRGARSAPPARDPARDAASPDGERAPADVLNEHQRRHMEVLLAQLEDSVARVERLADLGAGPGARLTTLAGDVAPGAARAIAPLVARVRERIAVLASRLDLGARQLSRLRAIRSEITIQRVRLEESTSRRLRGYGPVNPAAARWVDPELDMLHDLLRSILGLVEDDGGGSPASPSASPDAPGTPGMVDSSSPRHP